MALSIGLDQAEVVTELPPKPKRKGGHGRAPSKQYIELVEFIKAKAGEDPEAWVKVGTAEKRLQAQALAFRIRKGKSAAFKPAGAFEAESRPTGEDDAADVFVRYVGVPEDEDQLSIEDELNAAVESDEDSDGDWPSDDE